MFSILTVIPQTAEYIYDLTTVEAVNAELQIDGNTAADARTADQITAASKMIAELCNQVFAMQNLSQLFKLRDHVKILNLTRFPVIGEIEVVDESGATVDSAQYFVKADSGQVYHEHGHWRGQITINYTAGYNLPTEAPALLARACIGLVKAQRFVGLRDPAIRDIWDGESRISYSVGGPSGAVPPDVAAMIEKYKSMVAA